MKTVNLGIVSNHPMEICSELSSLLNLEPPRTKNPCLLDLLIFKKPNTILKLWIIDNSSLRD